MSNNQLRQKLLNLERAIKVDGKTVNIWDSLNDGQIDAILQAVVESLPNGPDSNHIGRDEECCEECDGINKVIKVLTAAMSIGGDDE